MRYINPKMLEDSLIELKNTPYFVDKTGLIVEATKSIRTKNKYLCITRPRRFGKTTNVQTLGAFLAKGFDVAELFEGLEVTKCIEAMQHFGAHDVIYIDFSRQMQHCTNYDDYITNITGGIIEDLKFVNPSVEVASGSQDLFYVLDQIYSVNEARYSFIMDEWDSIFFDDKFSKEDRGDYLKFLKQLLKDKPYVEFAYMTGIMPIAKHSSGSELNMFDEFTAINDNLFEQYFGFTEAEVLELCVKHKERIANPKVNYEGLKFWYDGYLSEDGTRKFNPRSVALALNRDKLCDFWTDSGPNFEIYDCIKHNIADVRDDISRMVAGEKVSAEAGNFAAADMTMETKDEIFSAMVVYGLLTYYDGSVSIPNYELMLKFEKTLKLRDVDYLSKLAKRSELALNATLDGEAETVAQIVEAAHDQEIPLLRYKNEADLAAVINLVYLYARNHYHVEREKSAGKGVADVAFIPKNPKKTQYSPFVVELKVAEDNETADDAATRAIEQIKQKDYLAIFKDVLTDENKFDSPPMGVAISWDPKDKKHACRIEEL